MILNAVEAGQGAGPPVVLLHGLFGQAGNFGMVQRRLSAERRVIALDLRNHGASPHDADCSYPAMAADVLETLAARDALPCALLGHSMGGKVAMFAALSDPAAVARLLVADIAPVHYRPHFADYIAAMRAIPLTPELTRAAAHAALTPVVPEQEVRGFLLQNLRFGTEPKWKLALPELAEGLEDIAEFPAPAGAVYPGPTLFLAGERSRYIRPEHRETIRGFFPAARMVTLRNAGHWLYADNPEGFLAVASAFLG